MSLQHALSDFVRDEWTNKPRALEPSNGRESLLFKRHEKVTKRARVSR